MFVAHRVQTDRRLDEQRLEFGERNVQFELNVGGDAELIGKLTQIVDPIGVFLIPTAADEKKFDAALLAAGQRASETLKCFNLQSMIFLRSKLGDRDDRAMTVVVVVGDETVRREILRIARRIDDEDAMRYLPQRINVILRPRRIDENDVGSRANKTVDARKESIVDEFEPGQETTPGDDGRIVEIVST